MEVRIMRRIVVIAALCVCLTGCGPSTTNDQLMVIQDSIAMLKEEIGRNQQDLAVVNDPVQRAKLDAANELMLKQIVIFENALKDAEDMTDARWGMGEAVIGILGGFFPPALLALPWIRTLRRQRSAIFKAVSAGGGVVDKRAAKAVLKDNPAAVAALAKWKTANGNTGATS